MLNIFFNLFNNIYIFIMFLYIYNIFKNYYSIFIYHIFYIFYIFDTRAVYHKFPQHYELYT